MINPLAALMARENRQFLGRAVTYIAGMGIQQFKASGIQMSSWSLTPLPEALPCHTANPCIGAGSLSRLLSGAGQVK